MFDRAIELSDTDVVIYTNGDILYTRDLLETVTFVASAARQLQKPPYALLALLSVCLVLMAYRSASHSFLRHCRFVRRGWTCGALATIFLFS